MAAVEVVSATSAFQAEKVEEPIKTDHEVESNGVKETETASPEAAEPTRVELVKETENVVAEPANGKPAAEEAEALASEVEAKVVVDVNQEETVGGDNAKVAPEPADEETLTKEAEPETKVKAEEAEHEPADVIADSEEVKPTAGEVEEEKAGDEKAAAEKSDE